MITIAPYRNTMARAVPVPDHGIDLSRKPSAPREPPKRRLVGPPKIKGEIVLSVGQAIVKREADLHGVAYREILSSRRTKELVAARRAAIVALHSELRIHGEPPSLNQIGKLMRKDHTTVLHALQKAGVK